MDLALAHQTSSDGEPAYRLVHPAVIYSIRSPNSLLSKSNDQEKNLTISKAGFWSAWKRRAASAFGLIPLNSRSDS